MSSGPDERDRRARRTKVGMVSLGCAKNLVDSEVMLGHLDRAGCEFVQDPAEAELIVVNTCAFIEPAREESVRTILEAARLKETGRLRRLIVAGCMVQRYPEELRRELPEVDAFVGLDELERIVECGELTATVRSDLPLLRAQDGIEATGPGAAVAPTAVAAWSPATYLYDDRTPRRLATPPWTAYLKIAEGCDHTCAFCAIPAFRGRFRSRQPDSVVREATSLAAAGVRELNLIAQDSSHYGRDLGLGDGLPRLLERLDAVPGLHWIRLHYLYPNTVTEDLIDTMARLPRVVPYVDIPLQHSHPAVLARMRRGGSAESHLRLLRRFREAMPDAALRSTLIVGFPGEIEEEFEHLLEFVGAAELDHLGVFSYSHEERTFAVELRDDVDGSIKQQRLERLMQHQQRLTFDRLQRWVGRRAEVLVEGAHPETEHLLVGRLAGQAQDVDGQVLINDGFADPGSFVSVELTGTAGYDLVGRVTGVDRSGAGDEAP